MPIARARSFLLAAAAVAAGGAIAMSAFTLRAPVAAAQTDTRPNIIVILVDDMGWSDIGSYGGEIPTPNLDALAARGVRFTQFYSTPRCSPTRASLLTGLYPHQAGMGHLDNIIRAGSLGHDRAPERPVRHDRRSAARRRLLHRDVRQVAPRPAERLAALAARLRSRAEPARRGHVLSQPEFEGGDDALTEPGAGAAVPRRHPTPRDSPVFGQDWYSTYLWTDFGLKFIDEARKANKPFFLYLPHNAPHFPLMAPPELIAKHRGKYRAGWDRLREARYRRQIKMGLDRRKWPLSPREADSPAWESLSDEAKDRFDHLMAVYAAMIEAIDISVGTLVKGLEARGVLDNTLILFLSDNGANAESGPDGRYNGDPPGGPNSNLYLGMNWAALSNTPFRRFKHFTHEGGIAAPLIAHWPRAFRPTAAMRSSISPDTSST